MSLILKINQPLLGLSVDFHRHYDGAGVDLLGFLQILQFALGAQLLHAQYRQIHQADKLIVSSFIKSLMVGKILIVGILDRLSVIAVGKCYVLKLRRKGRMTAVIGPISIQHPDLRDRGIPLFFILKIILDMKEILKGHCQVHGTIKLLERRLVHGRKAFQDLNILRLLKDSRQSLRNLRSRLPGIHRIDAEGLDRFRLLLRQSSLDHIRSRRTDHRLFLLV